MVERWDLMIFFEINYRLKKKWFDQLLISNDLLGMFESKLDYYSNFDVDANS